MRFRRIFSWSQNRLVLPAWLGAGEAIQYSVDQGHQALLEEMYRGGHSSRLVWVCWKWCTRKCNMEIAKYYDQRLVDKELLPLGELLREQLQKDIKAVLNVEK
ncbi:phosphoenolpyruvate carboxylase [Vibrio lentus]|nr:phosphoenolpyruvate carboxylase [Vibrio lentus]